MKIGFLLLHTFLLSSFTSLDAWCEDVEGRFKIKSVQRWIKPKKRNCAWASKKSRYRCKIKEIRTNCPVTCERCYCLDNSARFEVDEWGPLKSCKWARTKDTWYRCYGYPNVSDNCPLTCGKCNEEKPTFAPSNILSSVESRNVLTMPPSTAIAPKTLAPTTFPTSYRTQTPTSKPITPTSKPITPTSKPIKSPTVTPTIIKNNFHTSESSVTPVTATTSPTSCEDESEWETYDPDGFGSGISCLQIAEQPSIWCKFLASYSFRGKSTFEACCVCGGGSHIDVSSSLSSNERSKTQAPTTENPSSENNIINEPSSTPVTATIPPTSCEDESEWGTYDPDKLASGVTCLQIAEQPSIRCDFFAPYSFRGKSTLEACCVCGGGSHTDVSSSPS